MKFVEAKPDNEFYWLHHGKEAVFAEITLRDSDELEPAAVEIAQWCHTNFGQSGWKVHLLTGDSWDVDCTDPDDLRPIDEDYDGPQRTLVVYFENAADASIFKLTWVE